MGEAQVARELARLFLGVLKKMEASNDLPMQMSLPPCRKERRQFDVFKLGVEIGLWGVTPITCDAHLPSAFHEQACAPEDAPVRLRNDPSLC